MVGIGNRLNIWRIKSRWLRAPVAIVFATPLVFLMVFVTAIISICAGIGEGFSYAWHVFCTERHLKPTVYGWWRAVTFRSSAA